MSTRILLGVKTAGEKGDLITFTMPKVEKIQSLNLPDPQGPAQNCRGKTLPLPVYQPGKCKEKLAN
jgi:hypothetical protein